MNSFLSWAELRKYRYLRDLLDSKGSEEVADKEAARVLRSMRFWGRAWRFLPRYWPLRITSVKPLSEKYAKKVIEDAEKKREASQVHPEDRQDEK